MSSFQAPSQKYGIFAAITVLIIGPAITVFQDGFRAFRELSFWFGLYGWLAAGIIVGYLVYLAFYLFGLIKSDSSKINDEEKTLNAQTQISAGKLPAWEMGDLPVPPKFNLRNAIGIIGPGAILLGTSIGSGEWLLGPAVTSEYGGFLLWLVPVSIILQVIINTEFIRYTMYTGEPIYTGFMRTRPGPQFWGIFYIIAAFLQLGWPGWASAAATALTALYIGDFPTSEHAYLIKIFGFIWFISTTVIVIFGEKIEQTIELIQWFFIAAILLFLIFVAGAFTSPATWSAATRGITYFGVLPPGLDWVIISAFIADAGAGGVINGTIGNWFRDKGFAMGKTVGYIPAIIGGRKIALTKTGKIFPLTAENKKSWREWWKFVSADQYGIWAIGCFLGMMLPALITLEFVPYGTKFNNEFGIAVYQAQYMSLATGNHIFWLIILLIGFWILYSTQLGVTDAFVRMVTDIIWSGSSRIREWRGGDIRFVYYGVLSLFTLWGLFILLLDVKPLLLILIGANIAGLNFSFLGIHILYINRKFLPVELRPPLWREVVVLLGVFFYGFFFIRALPALIQQLSSLG
ncbi:MAG: Nramp family divalent metal transporter [Xenococcaceae cyanobacterium]